VYPESTLNQTVTAIQTADGGYLVAASNYHLDSLNVNEHRTIIIKTDAAGNKVFEKHLELNFGPSTLTQTPDGGFVLAGVIGTTRRIPYQTGGLIKLNASGDTLWTKTYPYIHLSQMTISSEAIALTTDGGYIAAGSVINRKVICYIKAKANGDSAWAKAMVYARNTAAHAIYTTKDSGSVIVGTDTTNLILTHINQNGDSVWLKSYKEPSGLQINGITAKQTSDGGFIALGESRDATNSWFLVKTNTTGDTLWTRTCTNSNYKLRNACIYQTSDQGYILMGDNSIHPTILKLDASGTILWVKSYEGSTNTSQVIHSGVLTQDGGCLLSGSTNDNQTGIASIYLLKTDASGNISNTISGTVFVDRNRNHVQDGSENGLSQRLVLLNPGSVYASTDNNGNYSFSVPAGSYTISLPSANYYGLEYPINNYSVTFTALGDSATNFNFADTLLVSCPDLTVSATTCGVRPCFKNTYTINYSNLGTIADTNAVITLQADTQIVFQSSSTPWTSSAAGIYTFAIGTVLPGQSGILTILDSVSCSLALNVNECLTASISSPMAECNSSNNNASDCHLTNGSFDPNAKKVASQNFQTKGFLTQETILPDDTLTYLITFQNTGTATAFNIVVTDTLSKLLDPSTIHPDAANASYTYSISSQGVVTWTFANIMLADSGTNEAASHGFIRFTVRQKPGNVGGQIIQSRASIVFDYNKPVMTNATVNPILLITGITAPAKGSASASRVFPNPFNGSATIEVSSENIAPGTVTQCIIYDMPGKQVASFPIAPGVTSDPGQPYTAAQIFDLSNLPKGMYFYTVTNNQKALSTGKMVIQ
jgi:uncharacterized repeat protein (TIGR01451 family)